jgi:hypothetical protein
MGEVVEEETLVVPVGNLSSMGQWPDYIYSGSVARFKISLERSELLFEGSYVKKWEVE